MGYTNIVNDLATQLIVAGITFVLGFVVSRFPGSVDKYKLRKFFGESFFTENFKVVYGVFTRISEKHPKKLLPAYKKVYSNELTQEIPAPYRIATEATLRGLSYCLQEFSKYRKKPFAIHTDEEVLPLHDKTFLCIGGPLSNEISDLALQDRNNKFLRFSIPESTVGQYATVGSISGAANFEKPKEAGHDYGVIIKVRNSRSPKNYYFVCAGLGSMGTSAAVWYLANYWRQLFKDFGSREFGIVVEVTRSQDSTATIVHQES